MQDDSKVSHQFQPDRANFPNITILIVQKQMLRSYKLLGTSKCHRL